MRKTKLNLILGLTIMSATLPCQMGSLPATRNSIVTAYVHPQAKIQAPGVLVFLDQDQVSYTVATYQIVTPSARSRVRLFVRAAKPLPSEIPYTVQSMQDSVGKDGAIGALWQLVATSSGDVSRFSLTLGFSLAAKDTTSVPLEWRYDIVTDPSM